MGRRNPSHRLNILFASVAGPLLMLTPRPALAFDERTLCTPLEIHQGGPEEKPCLEEFASVAKRNGRVLTLKLNNGKTKDISDTKECDDLNKEASCVTHRPHRRPAVYCASLALRVPLCAVGEPPNRRRNEAGRLARSPNRKRFVVTGSFAAGECSAEYNVAIFSLAIDPPRLEWRFTAPSDYEDYVTEGWDGESRVLLQGVAESAKRKTTDLKLTAQGWQLKRPNGETSLGERISPPAQPSSQRSPPPPPTTTAPDR
jgi:hypothetical protein